MLQIVIPPKQATELWDEVNEIFIEVPGSEAYILELEHSLASIHKWEMKWCKPFLSDKQMTEEESVDYIRCMTLTPNVPPEAYDNLPDDITKQVSDYIAAPMTATWFTEEKGKRAGREIVTAEVIYYWMIALTIPFECQYWHLNSLLTLVKVCNAKNNPKKGMGKKALLSHNAALNAARRKQLNSKG